MNHQHLTNIDQMRLTASYHIKYGLYKNPAFKFFQSMGMWNFFQGFKNDDLDLGVYHFYWDKDAENTIEYYDPNTGERTNNSKGDWRERWYNSGESIQPVGWDSPYRPDPEKLTKWGVEVHASMGAKSKMKQKEAQDEKSQEDEPWKHLSKPYREHID